MYIIWVIKNSSVLAITHHSITRVLSSFVSAVENPWYGWCLYSWFAVGGTYCVCFVADTALRLQARADDSHAA